MCEAAADNNLAQIARAMIINMMPPHLRTKFLEKNPKTMSDSLRFIEEGHRLLLDERRPVGNPTATQAVHVYHDNLGDSSTTPPQGAQNLEQVVEAVFKRQASNNQNFNSNNNNRRRNNNNESSKVDRSKIN